MMQHQAKPRSTRSIRSGRASVAKPRTWCGSEPRTGDIHLFDHPASRHARRRDRPPRQPSGSITPTCPAELIRQAYADALGAIRRRSARRSAPTSSRSSTAIPATHALHRAGALLQGLPRHPDPSPGALAVAQGPQGFRALPAKPLLGGVPDRHPSGGEDRARHLPRPRHRPRGRRDGGDRGRRVDAARRDARRHRQARTATATRRSATA